MLIDANLLLLAIDTTSPLHQRAAAWLMEQLKGNRRTGIPWPSLLAFVRISTHPRASDTPLRPETAWSVVEAWLQVPVVWIPGPTEQHADVLGSLIRKYRLAGNLVTDAHLAALAIEHGLVLCSADTDFARFSEIRWHNPLAA